jgi:cell division cycle 14
MDGEAWTNCCFNPILRSDLTPTLDRPVTVLTFCEDRLYLAAYTQPPDENTLFPYPESQTPRSPTKRSQRVADRPQPVSSSQQKQPAYFTVDDQLFYNAFHHDFGPFHIGHLYRFALCFHDVLGSKENKDKPIVFWSRADPRSKTLCYAFTWQPC